MSVEPEGDCIQLTTKLYSLHPIIFDKIFSIIELVNRSFTSEVFKKISNIQSKVDYTLFQPKSLNEISI